MDSFQQIDECIYSNKSLGASKQLETMACDCPQLCPEAPCTEEAGCVNRLTSIECYGSTGCLGRCANRRFQNKEFASVEVFDAGPKGYGVRTTGALAEGQFVYEYIGEVIDKARFERRKITYEREGVQHFYFMMLQKDEFIDATKKGSPARFLNHSCNPNCAVHKWVVGPKLRMGIFTLRAIEAGEELTFDYNAERFGDTVQECLCGESNCRGILNGKKDAIDLIPRSLWPILGLDTQVADSLREDIKTDKAFKKKKELDADIIALVPNTPVQDIEAVNQIVTFLMQPQEQFLVGKVLDRIYSTQAQNIQARLLKMHGYELFGTLLSQYGDNDTMVIEMLKVLEGWPRVTRNKISSSKIEGVVQQLVNSTSAEVVTQAKALLAEWSELEMAYRIPRRERDTDRDTDRGTDTPENARANPEPMESPDSKTPTSLPAKPATLPPGWYAAYKDEHVYYYNRELNITQWEFPQDTSNQRKGDSDRDRERERKRAKERDERREKERQREREREREKERERERELEERAKQQKEQEAAELQRIIEAAADTSSVVVVETPKKPLSDEEKLERKFTHTLAGYVPKVVFKYKEKLDHERCKKHSKEIVKILVDKEMRKGSKELELNEAKKKKIKGFVSEYIKKLLERKGRPSKEEPPQKKVKTN